MKQKIIIRRINSKILVSILLFSSFGVYLNAQQPNTRIKAQSGKIVLDFAADVAKATAKNYTIQRANGRFGHYEVIGTAGDASFIDNTTTGNPYNYYYQIADAEGNILAQTALDTELFGPNMYIYSPEDDKTAIGEEINDIHDAMFQEQFGSGRYAFFFKQGDYTGTVAGRAAVLQPIAISKVRWDRIPSGTDARHSRKTLPFHWRRRQVQGFSPGSALQLERHFVDGKRPGRRNGLRPGERFLRSETGYDCRNHERTVSGRQASVCHAGTLRDERTAAHHASRRHRTRRWLCHADSVGRQ
jgi:hypothetical protein